MSDTLDQKIKVIIADDQQDFARSLKRGLFSASKFDVDIVINADELIEKAMAGNYKLILTDNDMEDGHDDSGVYAIRKLRDYDIKTPIILHSGYIDDELKQRALEAGADIVLKKGATSLIEYKKIVELILR